MHPKLRACLMGDNWIIMCGTFGSFGATWYVEIYQWFVVLYSAMLDVAVSFRVVQGYQGKTHVSWDCMTF